MENASDALKIAFAVFVFIAALSIVFSLVSKVLETAEVILFNVDKTAYYDYAIKGNTEGGRVVGIDTIISTLMNYRKQSAYVIIKEGNSTTEFDFSATINTKINDYIERNINNKAKYTENVREITVGGEYRIAEDGTKITIHPGKTRTYIIYTKK